MKNNEGINIETVSQAKLKREVQEAIAEIERGDYMNIDEAFEKAIAKIKNIYQKEN